MKQTVFATDLSPYMDSVSFAKIADERCPLMSSVRKMLIDRSGNLYLLDDRGELMVLAPDGKGGIYLFSAFPSDPSEGKFQRDSLLYRLSTEGRLTGSYLTRIGSWKVYHVSVLQTAYGAA